MHAGAFLSAIAFAACFDPGADPARPQMHAGALLSAITFVAYVQPPTAIPLALVLLLAASVPPTVNANLGPRERTLAAYDCSQPQQKVPLQPPQRRECEKDDNTATQVNSTYAVIQRAAWARAKATRCVETRTILAFYCGAYSHQTYIPDMSSVHVLRTIAMSSTIFAVCGKSSLTHAPDLPC